MRVKLYCNASDFSYPAPFPVARLTTEIEIYRGFPQSNQANTSATFYIIPPNSIFVITYTSYSAI